MAKLEYLDFELRIGDKKGQSYPVAVIRSPAGEVTSRLTLPFSGPELEKLLADFEGMMQRSRETRMRRIGEPALDTPLKQFGDALCQALFAGPIGSRYEASLQMARQTGKGLRLKVRIEAPELANIPWEFLYDASHRRFPNLSTQTPLVRYLEVPLPVQPLAVQPPLQMLVMISSPSDYPPLDLEKEKGIVQATTKDLPIALTFLEKATPQELQSQLRRTEFHILHFMGPRPPAGTGWSLHAPLQLQPN